MTATIAALVLGLLIAAAKGSFDTQTSQVRQITANLILLDNILAQYGPEARPIREHMRSAIGPFADRLWREKEAATSGPFETNVAAERVYLEIHKLSPHDDLQRSLQSRAVQISNDLAQLRFMLFVESENLIPTAVSGSPRVLARDRVRELQLVFASEPDALHLPFLVCLFGGVRNFSDLGTGPTVHRTDDDIQRTTAKRAWNNMRSHHECSIPAGYPEQRNGVSRSNASPWCLQGGGALGAYQAGVYEALAEANINPDWVAGVSIGAINSAIIAGNEPAERVAKLRTFWQEITANPLLDWAAAAHALTPKGDLPRALFNQLSATYALIAGAAGFFTLRQPAPWLHPNGALEATSFYETKLLKSTLERLVDFDRINAGEMRFSVGAVNVRTGNFVYFDNETHTIRPEHVMASGSLPPGFPAVEIEGEFYWDGGLISNTPLQWVVEQGPRQDTLAFQVDLWSARGELPGNLADVVMRQKEIQYSSRTRANTDQFKQYQRARKTLASLLSKLPADLLASEEARMLSSIADHKVYSLVQLIYRSKHYEGHSKDYEFSRLSMEEHWRAGYHDAVRTLRHPEALQRPRNQEGVCTFDLAVDGRE